MPPGGVALRWLMGQTRNMPSGGTAAMRRDAGGSLGGLRGCPRDPGAAASGGRASVAGPSGRAGLAGAAVAGRGRPASGEREPFRPARLPGAALRHARDGDAAAFRPAAAHAPVPRAARGFLSRCGRLGPPAALGACGAATGAGGAGGGLGPRQPRSGASRGAAGHGLRGMGGRALPVPPSGPPPCPAAVPWRSAGISTPRPPCPPGRAA